MNPEIFWQLNESYQRGVYGQVDEDILTEEEYLDIEEWVEDLIAEGYDLDDYTDDELYEAYLDDLYEDEAWRERNFKPMDPYKKELVQARHAELAGKTFDARDKVKQLQSKRFKRFRPGLRRQIVSTAKSGQTSGRLAMKAGEGLMRQSDYEQDQRKKKIGALKGILGALEGGLDSNNIRKFRREEFDLYDVISNFLVQEGYCNSYQDADVIMANMSEEWRDDIVEELLNERLTGRRVKRAITKFQDQNDRPDQYRKPSENKNPRPNYTLGAVATHKEGSPNPHNPATPEDYRDGGNRPTKRGGRGEKGKAKTGYYGTDRRDSDRGSGNAARRRASGR